MVGLAAPLRVIGFRQGGGVVGLWVGVGNVDISFNIACS